MAQQDSRSYEFGRFRLIPAERVLLRDDEFVPLTPKVFDILVILIENNGKVVRKGDLMKRVWPDTFVEEGNLTQNISLLRKALGETPGGVQFIETVPRRGYRFVGETSETSDGESVLLPIIETTVSDLHAPSRPSWSRRTPTFAVVAGLVVMAIISLFYFTGRGKAGNPSAIQSIAVLPF